LIKLTKNIKIPHSIYLEENFIYLLADLPIRPVVVAMICAEGIAQLEKDANSLASQKTFGGIIDCPIWYTNCFVYGFAKDCVLYNMHCILHT